MNRYEFTTREGYLVCVVEARTAAEAREKAKGHPRAVPVMHCTHLSDGYRPSGIDSAFLNGPG